MAQKVAFFDYPRLYRQECDTYLSIVDDVLSRGAYILQRDLAEFEERLARYLGVKHALGMADCTNALFWGLMAMEIGAGDEVIFPSHTFVASAEAIRLTGATPVPADIGQDGLLDATAVERRITSRTKAIMPVQLNGRVCDMDALQRLAELYSLAIVEDSAQALGAAYRGRYAGTFGRFGAFSFYPAKTLGGFGDGGALVTSDDDIARTVQLMRDHGRSGSPEVQVWGGNCRLDNLQAAILTYKLDRYDEAIARRRAIAQRYHDAMFGIEDLRLPEPPSRESERFHIYQNYELEAGRRDELRTYLGQRGIATAVQWGGKAVHQFEALGFKEELPRTEAFFRRCLMLPMHDLLRDDEVEAVCQAVRSFYGLPARCSPTSSWSG